ncbi:hypothetical protein H6F93_09830 [Leptolyngbya sp. FACHB-671]|uniref:hypothetical protein n=1 Tax=Leptolyngbya sp. FACHB-671 TaxID=2692812 RepID=UPI0016893A82|nr:hypothetical protein [Leptolyngbya sp. FACHB-671]MBD2067816.1 hypothetical protein [Leptolyngbya sp. FACHB-671]
MQLISSEQQYIPTSQPANEQWKQTLALEKEDEIVLLREQINSLKQYLSEQLQQQQVIEQDLHYARQELELVNAEIQLMVEAKCLFFEEIKECMRTLPNNGKASKEAFLRLCSKFYNEINFSKESEPIEAIFNCRTD